jgi:DMSO/TMAO reductase YedYZ molybdopterin-dependent catalytic subunit
VFPRFGDVPGRRPAPADQPIALRISGDGFEPFTIERADLEGIERVVAVHDFHCVATWTHRANRWSGWPLAEVWSRLVEPRLGGSSSLSFAVGRGGDRYQAVFALDDLLGPDVLLATALDGADLGPDHGAPMRLVSPAQYGYKSVKHLVGFELREQQPASGLGPKEHLRARVALEERHSRVPGRLLRAPYRALVVPTALVAARASAAASAGTNVARPAADRPAPATDAGYQ